MRLPNGLHVKGIVAKRERLCPLHGASLPKVKNEEANSGKHAVFPSNDGHPLSWQMARRSPAPTHTHTTSQPFCVSEATAPSPKSGKPCLFMTHRM